LTDVAKQRKTLARMAKSRTRRYPNLTAYFAHSGESQSDLAARLRLPQSTISRVARGLRIPRPRLARRLIRACGIPAESFTAAYLSYRRRHPDKDKSKRKAA
jgi:transcriptional regulator with XRE-family HTH domain